MKGDSTDLTDMGDVVCQCSPFSKLANANAMSCQILLRICIKSLFLFLTATRQSTPEKVRVKKLGESTMMYLNVDSPKLSCPKLELLGSGVS